MRELKVVGLDVDGKRIICETDDSGEKFILRSDDRLRAAVRGDQAGCQPNPIRCRGSKRAASQGDSSQDPRGRIRRAGRRGRPASTSPGSSGSPIPVLLERSRAAELATAAHPVLADGPSVLTLLETVTTALIARGLDPDVHRTGTRGATRTAAGPCSWPGRPAVSDNVAHFRFTPGAHGGTVDRVRRRRLRADRPRLRPPAAAGGAGRAARRSKSRGPAAAGRGARPEPPKPARTSRAPRKGKPAVPAWEDVLLGVRSSGQR